MTPFIDPALALEVAAQIGFGIARRAFWHGDRCTWLEAIPVEQGQNPSVSAFVGPDVYGGTAGLGWFLAEAAARTSDALLRRAATAALRQAAVRAPEQLAAAPHGFYGGVAGTGAALIAAGQKLGDEASIAAGRDLLLQVPPAPVSGHGTDVISGLAGTVLALALAADRLGEPALLERAGEVAAGLLAMGEAGRDGSLSWPTMPSARSNLTGFAHGAAGIAYALLVLDALAPDEALRRAAAGGLRYESTAFNAERGGWPDYRLLPGYPSDQIFYPVAWCHGAAGIAQSRLAIRHGVGIDVAADIDAGLAATQAETQRILPLPGMDFTLCHGLLGLADALLDGLRAGHSAAEPVLAALAAHCVQAYHLGERPWPSGLLSREETSGLMLGNAGIGWFFLRLADPALESVLVPGATLLGPAQPMSPEPA